jgi:hypothetical protein
MEQVDLHHFRSIILPNYTFGLEERPGSTLIYIYIYIMFLSEIYQGACSVEGTRKEENHFGNHNILFSTDILFRANMAALARP